MNDMAVHIVCHRCFFEGLVVPHETQRRPVRERADEIIEGHEDRCPESNVRDEEVEWL